MIHVIYLAIIAVLVALVATYKSAVDEGNRQFADLEKVARQAIDGWAASELRTRESAQRMNAMLDRVEMRQQA